LPAAAAGPETEKLGAALLLGVPAAATARLGPACARLLLLPPLRCALFSAGNAGGASRSSPPRVLPRRETASWKSASESASLLALDAVRAWVAAVVAAMLRAAEKKTGD